MSIEIIKQSPIVPVYYNDDIEKCKDVLKQCYSGGVRVFEFVDRGPQSEINFNLLVDYKSKEFPDLLLGIGTIKNELQAKKFISLGADFLVSPIINKELATEVKKYNIPWIPGCMTPSEIAMAEREGVKLVKLFPGDLLGPSFVKAIKPLFPNMRYIVTGGVSLSENNLKSWFESGVHAVGVGSKLFDGEFIAGNKNIKENLNAALNFLKSIREKV